MNTFLIVAAMITAQCGNGCPRLELTLQNATVSAPDQQWSNPGLYHQLRNYSVTHEGLSLKVNGYLRHDGLVLWSMAEPYNVWSLARAKQDAESLRNTSDIGRIVGPIASVTNFGVDEHRVAQVRGVIAKSEEAKRFVQEAVGGIIVDSIHVTVIGTDSERQRVVRDLNTHPSFDGIRSSLMIQDYRPDEWPVDKSLGFVVNGNPTILVQTAKGPSDTNGGRVIFRADDYSIGPDGLAEAIRKADPSYDPSKDPSPTNKKRLGPLACPLGFNATHWPHILRVGVLVFIIFSLPKKGS